MWFRSPTSYAAVYPEEAIEGLQTAVISAISVLCGYKITSQQALDSRYMLLGFLNDIRQSEKTSDNFINKLSHTEPVNNNE